MSEGPSYFIIPLDKYKLRQEILVRKYVMQWMKDPVLEALLGEKISVTGEITETKDTMTIDYTEVQHNDKIIPTHKKSGKVVGTPQELDQLLKELKLDP